MQTQRFQDTSDLICNNIDWGKEFYLTGTNFCGNAYGAGAKLPAWWLPPPSYLPSWPHCATAIHGDYIDGYIWQGEITLGGGGVSGPPVAQFGSAANPIQPMNDPQNNPVFGNTLNFNLIGPVKMVVTEDKYDFIVNTVHVRRLTTYQVINSDGSTANNIPLGEVNDYGSSTCYEGRPFMNINSCTVATNDPIDNPSGPPQNKSAGMYATDTSGGFQDQWSMGKDTFTPPGCGYPVNYDHWQLCGYSYSLQSPWPYINTGLTFATLQGSIHTNYVTITLGGHDYILPGLPNYPPNCQPNQTGCPNAIPNGTVVTP